MRIRRSGVVAATLVFFASSCSDAPYAPARALIGGPSASIAPTSAVRISEIHYDNAGTDAGEAIELSGPADMSLAGWSIVLYNGSNGAVYNTRTLTSEALSAACGAAGVHTVAYAMNGIQNGNPDGIALVDDKGALVEFLSYGGSMIGVGGPADGVQATDIGVAEGSGTAAGASLERIGLTTWRVAASNSFGACNYTEAPPGDLAAIAIAPDAATIVIGATQQLQARGADADGQPVPASVTWTSGNESVATVSASGLVNGVAVGEVTITAASGEIAGTAVITVERPGTAPAGSVWISELHYDNASTDQNEGIEIEGPAGLSLAGWRVLPYNGNGGVTYSPAPTLSATIPDQCNGRGTVHVPIAGLQNGDPDGVALVNAAGVVVEFISYGGVVTATNGPAVGLTSVDIGVKESSTTTATQSLQRKGTRWEGPLAATFGACNGGGTEPPPPTGDKRVSIFGRNSGDPALPIGFEYQLFADYFVGALEVPTTITWRSTDERIVTIDQDGVVHAVAAGSARVEAVAADGTVGSFTVRTQSATASTTAQYLDNVEFGTPADADPSDDFIVARPQFTSSYSARRNTPNWVSWTLDASQFGALDRCNCFTMDPSLPGSFTRITTADYTGAGAVAGYGIDRGHLVRSFDRTAGVLDNASTFLFTNIIPQAADNNQGPWAALETELGNRARTGSVVYNVAGVAGEKGTVKNEGVIVIPEYVWKVAVIMPRGEGLDDVDRYDDVEVIAVIMPNRAGIRNDAWTRYSATVDDVERLAGYDLLDRLRDDIEIAVESDTKPPIAVANGPYAAIRNEAIEMSAAASTDPDGDALTFAWTFGDGGSAAGVQATHRYASAGTYAVRLIATDVRGLADTTVTTATVASYAETVRAAEALVASLVAAEKLPAGSGHALQAKLEATLHSLDGDRATARVHLQQAARQLEIFARQRFVTEADAEPLARLLRRLLAVL